MDAAALAPELLAGLPPGVAQFIQALVEENARLRQRVAELETRLGKNSTNSSEPPSTEHPHAKPARATPKSRRRAGGQPGHPKHERALIPADQCHQVVTCRPTTCRRCGDGLSGDDPEPLRHQVWELPEIRPTVTEYQRHRLVCGCGCSTCGPLPAGVPTGQAGPRVIAFSGLLMACFRQSKRRAARFLGMILNQPASPGWLVVLQDRAAAAVEPAYDELAAALPAEPVLHVDEPPTKQGPAKAWVWTFVARGVHPVRLPGQPGGRGSPGPARSRVRRGDPVRPGPDVLGVRPAAVLLGSPDPGFQEPDRESVRGHPPARPGPPPPDPGDVRPVAEGPGRDPLPGRLPGPDGSRPAAGRERPAARVLRCPGPGVLHRPV
ncbi:MAG: Transposase family protein [Gemmataceae bacterium]|nr:Transposase family protein [Gemmataceae bacterium]